VSGDPKVGKLLKPAKLAACFDLAPYLARARMILTRAVPRSGRRSPRRARVR
jgi:hypothetical protein